MPDGSSPSTADPESTRSAPITRQSRGFRALLDRFVGPKHVGLDGVLQNGSSDHVDLTPAERTMIERIISFDKKRVDDVAIPRADIVGVELTCQLKEILETFSGANHSRLPVYRGDLDDPVGMVHIKDVVGLLADPEVAEDGDARPLLDRIKRKILYVPPSMPVTDLLLRMQASRVHMALVIDEYGGTDGLVTIEDLIELIVGDIRDEHDDAQDYVIKQVSDDHWEVDARAPVEELEGATGFNLQLDDHDADTIGGLVFSLAGRVPLRGEVIPHPLGYEVDIADADPRSIRRVVLRKAVSPSEIDAKDEIEEPASVSK